MAVFQDIQAMFGDRKWPEVASTPAWSDLEEERIAEDSDAVSVISSLFSQKRPILLVSPAKRGKTFLVRSMGFCMTADGCEIRQTNAQYINPNDAIVEIRTATKSNQAFVYIIEDCHRELGRAGQLLQWVCSHSWNQCNFLFTIRGSSIEDLLEPYRTLVDDNNISLVLYQPREGHVISIINKFCDAIRYTHMNSPCLNPSDEEIAVFVAENHIGSDLERLMRFMKTWEQQCDNVPLDEVSEESVLRLVWNQFQLDDVRTRDVLCRLSALGQYEVDTEAGFIEELELSRELQQLGRQQGIVYFNVTPAGHKVTLKEEEDSEWILAAVSRFRPKFDRDQYVSDTVKRYVVWGAFNAHRLLGAIALEKTPKPLVEILNDPPALAAVKVSLARQTHTTLLHVLEPINRLVPQLGQNLTGDPNVQKTLTDEAKGGSAYRLRKSIRLLHKVMNLHHLFADWTQKDWHSTIDSSSLHTLRLLCYDFQRYRLWPALTAIATHIPTADLDKLLDTSEGVSLKELDRFIGNIVRFVPRISAQPFIEGLANRDLTQLAQGADSGDLGRFIRIVTEYAPSKASQVAEGLHEKLRSLIETTDMPHRFWLLWETYKAEPTLAASLAQTHSVKDWIHNESAIFYLASVGLQIKCGKDVSGLAFPLDDSVVQAFDDELGQDKPNVTLLVLALTALTKLWSKEQCSQFNQEVDMLSLRQKIEDINLPSTRTHLLRDYGLFTSII